MIHLGYPIGVVAMSMQILDYTIGVVAMSLQILDWILWSIYEKFVLIPIGIINNLGYLIKVVVTMQLLDWILRRIHDKFF